MLAELALGRLAHELGKVPVRWFSDKSTKKVSNCSNM